MSAIDSHKIVVITEDSEALRYVAQTIKGDKWVAPFGSRQTASATVCSARWALGNHGSDDLAIVHILLFVSSYRSS